MATLASVSSLLAQRQDHPANGAKPMAGPGSGGGNGDSGNAGNSATISSNDFLTLLVTEMKNQDPTQATDPNQYINQLVNVNSLEQLISINQELKTAMGQSTTASATATTGQAAAMPVSSRAGLASTAVSSAQSATGTTKAPLAATGLAAAVPGQTLRKAPGNLSVPEANRAAQRVAQSLNGKHRPS